jgi:hypothetical protein
VVIEETPIDLTQEDHRVPQRPSSQPSRSAQMLPSTPTRSSGIRILVPPSFSHLTPSKAKTTTPIDEPDPPSFEVSLNEEMDVQKENDPVEEEQAVAQQRKALDFWNSKKKRKTDTAQVKEDNQRLPLVSAEQHLRNLEQGNYGVGTLCTCDYNVLLSKG